MGKVKAGALDRRVTIQRPGPPTDDGYTTLPGALADYYTCSASWKPARGNEVFENSGREAYSGGTLWIRYNPTAAAIRATDKVLFGGQVWDIVAPPAEIGRREGIELILALADADDLEAPAT